MGRSAQSRGIPHAAHRLPKMLTIGDMARRYGLTLRALRFYEDRKLVKPLRLGAARFYDADACRRIETILRAKNLGYTLGAIAAMLARDGDAALERAAVSGELAGQIERLERKRAISMPRLRTSRRCTSGQRRHRSVAARPNKRG